MMSQPTIDTISQEVFDEAVQTYISWAAGWDGSLPADTFFGVWADLQKEKKPLALKARVVILHLPLATCHLQRPEVAKN